MSVLSGVYDQLNAPNLCFLEEITRRVRQLVAAHMSGAHGKPNWTPVKRFTSVHSSSNIVPPSMRSFALRTAKGEVETENLRLRATKTVPVFEDGEWETRAAPHMLATKSKGKGKERAAAAHSCCGQCWQTFRPGAALAFSGRPRSHIGFRSSTLSLKVPTLSLSRVPHNPCARCASVCVVNIVESATWCAALNL